MSTLGHLTKRHDHDDPERLYIGCAACIARVKEDQFAAALAEAPTRRIEVEWHTTVRGTVSLEVSALPGEDAETVAERNEQLVADAIEDAYIDRWATVDIEWDDVSFVGDTS